MSVILIVDGNGLMHRAYHALPPFQTASGIPTHVVYGFFSIIHKTVSDFHPTHLLICFDTPAPTFRNKLFKEYQAQRPSIADDFRTQIPMVKQALDLNGTVHKELDGYEGDDVMGTAARAAEKEGYTVLILTGDKDMMQLVTPSVSTVTPEIGFAKTKIYDEAAVREKMGVSPTQIPDLKALAGDPSDNYKGAEGIGPKTAQKLLLEYKTVPELLKGIRKLPEGKVKDRITASIENIQVGLKLATVNTQAPIDLDLEKTVWNGFSDALKQQFLTWEMYSLVARLYPKQKSEVQKKKVKKVDENQFTLF